MPRTRRVALAGALVLLSCVAASAQEVALTGLDGSHVRPFASHARAWVFVFSRTDCPVAARYAPEIERLQRRLAGEGMDFALVFVDPAESADAIRSYLSDYGYTGRALRDPGHALVHLAGATATPEAAVFVRGEGRPTLVYRGRIDDRYVDIGRVRPAPTRHDLDEVVAAIRDGQLPPFRSTQAIGCLIADVSR